MNAVTFTSTIEIITKKENDLIIYEHKGIWDKHLDGIQDNLHSPHHLIGRECSAKVSGDWETLPPNYNKLYSFEPPKSQNAE